MRFKTDIPRAFTVLAVLTLVTFVYRELLPVNPTTVALTFLVLVLITSAFWGFRIALLASLAATSVFNFFFLPPFKTFTIADPQNWVSLFAFLITAVIASNLAERARKQAELAQQRRQEVERLYSLSQRLLTSDTTVRLFNELPRHFVETFGCEDAALVVSGHETVYLSSADMAFDREQLFRTRARSEITEHDHVTYLPLRTGVKPTGALALKAVTLSRETLDAIGSLVGIAAERTRAVDELADTRAQQESEKLRTALLDSVTHELRTPLTSIKASVTGLLDEGDIGEAERRELLTVIDEEADRLNRLVGEAAEMAQLDAHMFTLDRKPHAMREVVEAALDSTRVALKSRNVTVVIPDELPGAEIDFERIKEVLIHLLENAAKYSSPQSPIQVSADQTETEIRISVADQGSGIDPLEQPLIFDKFYRGRDHRLKAKGTGMGLAISRVIVEAHGGQLSLVSQPGQGSVFTIAIPRVPR